MKTTMKIELSEMRRNLIELERAFETSDENKMFLALAGIRQASAYFGRELTRKVNRRVTQAAKAGIVALALILGMNHSDAAEYPLICGRVMCDAHDGIMTYQGKFALVSVNPSRFRFTYACWRTFDTLAEAKAAQKAQGK